MHSAEHDENYNNPLTHILDPNPILALQFYYYYIASEGSVNTPFIVVVSPLLNSRDTIPIRLTINQVLCPQNKLAKSLKIEHHELDADLVNS
jgi:hypothetical protein